jgi:hypothetical protein
MISRCSRKLRSVKIKVVPDKDGDSIVNLWTAGNFSLDFRIRSRSENHQGHHLSHIIVINHRLSSYAHIENTC